MADAFSPDAFYDSGRAFALSALEAHHAGNRRRVPLHAGTALEHLAKACLARRSLALLAELKNNSGSIKSLIGLLRIEGAGGPASIRTVGLSEALARAGLFVRPKAAGDDLRLLIEMRNGIVHAADDADVEERVLAAFAQQADALLADLGTDRKDFWDGQLAVVNALLTDASDKLMHRVEVRLAAAAAMLARRMATEGEAVISVLRGISKNAPVTAAQRLCECPYATHPRSPQALTPSSGLRVTGIRRPARSAMLKVRSGSRRRHFTARYAACGWIQKPRSTPPESKPPGRSRALTGATTSLDMTRTRPASTGTTTRTNGFVCENWDLALIS